MNGDEIQAYPMRCHMTFLMSQHYPAYLYTTPVNQPQFNPAAYYPQFPHITPQPQHLSRPASPDPAPVSPQVASKTVQRLIYAELKQVGFDSASSASVQRLEDEVVACTYSSSLPTSCQVFQLFSISMNAPMSMQIWPTERDRSLLISCALAKTPN